MWPFDIVANAIGLGSSTSTPNATPSVATPATPAKQAPSTPAKQETTVTVPAKAVGGKRKSKKAKKSKKLCKSKKHRKSRKH